MDFTIKTDKNDYFKCSMYYMRRYFGLRETLLLAFLLLAGVLLYVFTGMILILIFFGITCAVLVFTLILFLWTSISGYKHETVKQGIAVHKIHFGEEAMRVGFYSKTGELLLEEEYDYKKIEAVAVKKNFVFIYAGVAIFFYFFRKKIGDTEFAELIDFLRNHLEQSKFRFKQVKRMFPKKKKITFDNIPTKKQ